MAVSSQFFLSEMGNMPIIEQRVVVRDEKSQVWFVVQHVPLHVFFFFLLDVGRIADDDVQNERNVHFRFLRV